MMDYDALKEEVSHYGNYMAVQDHVIAKGMKMEDGAMEEADKADRQGRHRPHSSNKHP